MYSIIIHIISYYILIFMQLLKQLELNLKLYQKRIKMVTKLFNNDENENLDFKYLAVQSFL